MVTSLHFKVPPGVIWACGLSPTSEVVRGLSRLFEAVFRKSCIWHFFIMSGRIEAIRGRFLKSCIWHLFIISGRIEAIRGRFLKKLHMTVFHHIGANWGGDLWGHLRTKSAAMLILMVELKVCRWRRASARGSGERSEPAAGRPRKEQAPKAPSRIASKVS